MKRFLWLILIVAFFAPAAWAAPAIVREPVVCDVTPRSFSVAWVTDVAADPALTVYDESGADITSLVTRTAFPSLSGSQTLVDYAKNAGVMKVRVSGLAPDTAYAFKAKSTASDQTTTWPADATVAVRTRTMADLAGASLAPAANDLAMFFVYRPDMSTAARGSLVLCEAPGAGHPVSAYVGDGSVGTGAEPGFVLLDLNNLYDSATGKSLYLSGQAVLTLRALRGNGAMGDELLHYRIMEPQTGTARAVPLTSGYFADINCDDSVDLLDATLLTGGWGLAVGDAAYNPDHDMNGDGIVDAVDSTAFTAEYGKAAPFVD
ncbi:MAG: hypothetical protein ACLFOY_02315 [Desulfatibacillaceae bacterium]